MKKLTKQNQEQNYLILPAILLKVWFDRMHQEQFGALATVPKALPSVQSTQENSKLDIHFSDWDMPVKHADLLIEEYLWGIRYGIMQYIDVERCSFAEVLEIAKTDDMSELYSPAKVQYFSDGTRKVVPQNVSVYNTDVKFGCWYLINIEQAKHFFPQYSKIFDTFPQKTKFLCSPEMDKLRIASQENGEIGFSFSAVDASIKDIGFYLGHLRPSFQYIAREIGVGGGAAFCDPKRMKDLDYLKSKSQKLLNASVDEESAGLENVSAPDNPEREWLVKCRRKLILKAVDELPKEMRKAIVLVEFEGLNYDAAARRLGINVGTLKSRLHNAKAKLHEKLAYLEL